MRLPVRSAQMLGIVVQRDVKTVFVLVQDVQAYVGMSEIVHPLKGPLREQAQEAAHRTAVHANEDGFFFLAG